MKKAFSWLLVLTVLLQLLTPMGVHAANDEYFIINTMDATPGEPIQIRYNFRAISGENYTLYLKNTNGTVYQSWDLTCQQSSSFISGLKQFAAPSDTGQYEFQLYGRLTEETYDLMERIGMLSNFYLFVAKHTDLTGTTFTALELIDFCVGTMVDTIGDIMPTFGTFEEEEEEPVMLFKSPPMEVREYSARVWSSISPWPGSQMNVSFENVPGKDNSFIGLYSLGVSDEYWSDLQSTGNNTTGNVWFDMPMMPGAYHFRSVYFTNGYYARTGISSPFYVMPHNTVFRNIPDKINPIGQLNIQIENAPYGERTWAGIYPLNSMRYDSYWGNLVSLSNSNSGVINATAPSNPGVYCIRVFSQGSDTIYISTSSPFQVAVEYDLDTKLGKLGNVGQKFEVDHDLIIGLEGQLSPLTLQAQAGNSHIKLNWTRVADSQEILGYNVYRSTTSGGQTEVPLNSSIIRGTSYTDRSVTVNTPYYYTVRPVFRIMSNEVSAAPKKWMVNTDKVNDVKQELNQSYSNMPSQTFALAATAGNSCVDVEWKPFTGNNVLGYNLYRGTSSGKYEVVPIKSFGKDIIKYTDKDVKNGVAYYYTIKAVFNDKTESGPANEVTAKPVAPIKPPAIKLPTKP